MDFYHVLSCAAQRRWHSRTARSSVQCWHVSTPDLPVSRLLPVVGSEQERSLLCVGSGWSAQTFLCPSTSWCKNPFLQLCLCWSTVLEEIFYILPISVASLFSDGADSAGCLLWCSMGFGYPRQSPDSDPVPFLSLWTSLGLPGPQPAWYVPKSNPGEDLGSSSYHTADA